MFTQKLHAEWDKLLDTTEEVDRWVQQFEHNCRSLLGGQGCCDEDRLTLLENHVLGKSRKDVFKLMRRKLEDAIRSKL